MVVVALMGVVNTLDSVVVGLELVVGNKHPYSNELSTRTCRAFSLKILKFFGKSLKWGCKSYKK